MYRIQFRRDESTAWLLKNPILREGEPGLEIDTGKLKIGDGTTRWFDLEYFVPGEPKAGESSDMAELRAHINSSIPHPVYDDGPSLLLLYQNAKV